MASPKASQSGFSQTNAGSSHERDSEGKGGDTAEGADGCPPDVGGGRAHDIRFISMWCPRSPTRSMMMCMEANSHCPARQV